MKSFLNGYTSFLQRVLTLLMGLMIVPVFLQVLSRFLGIIPIHLDRRSRSILLCLDHYGRIDDRRTGRKPLRRRRHSKTEAISQPGHLPVDSTYRHAVASWDFPLVRHRFRQVRIRSEFEMSGINMLSIYISFPLAGLSWALFLGERSTRTFA